MKNVTTNVGCGTCTANITKNRNRLKIYSNTDAPSVTNSADYVYLKDGQNFELELFNPHKKKVLAKIYLNGILMSSGGIILRPGERVFLERFIDKDRKFAFSTYKISGKSEEAIEAIKKNGLVRVEFFHEQEPSYFSSIMTTNTYYGPLFTSPGIYSCDLGRTNYFSSTTAGGYTNTLGNIGTPGPQGNIGNVKINESLLAGSTLNSSNTSYFSDTSNVSASYTSATDESKYKSLKKVTKDTIETGSIEQGSLSEQKLVDGSGNFNFFYTETFDYQILPESQKSVTYTEIRQYCSGCGIRVKNHAWKFCPGCGTRV